MGNCLVTKLNGIVDNDNLLKLGEVEVVCPALGSILWFPSGSNTTTITNKTGYFVDKTTSEQVKTITISSALSNYKTIQRDTIIIHEPSKITYMESPSNLADNPYALGYFTNARSFYFQNVLNKEFPVTFTKFIDLLSENRVVSYNKLAFRGYDLTEYSLSELINHSSFNTLFKGIAELGFPQCRNFNINIADLAEFSAVASIDFTWNNVSGTIESFVAAMRTNRPNVNSFDFQFSCIDDRNNITATFNGTKITEYEDTYWAHHELTWTANTITFMGTTINA